MDELMNSFLGMTVRGAPPEREFPYYNFPSYFVYYGSSGRALTFFKLYLNDINGPSASYYLTMAK